MREVRTVGIVGAEAVSAEWCARFLARGLDVVLWAPGDDRHSDVSACVMRAWPALSKQGLFPGASPERLRFADSLESLVEQSDLIQNTLGEDGETDGLISEMAGQDVIISTCSLNRARGARHSERVLSVCVERPVYLLPVLEIIRGQETSEEVVAQAREFYGSVGFKPFETQGPVTGRLSEALRREARAIKDGGTVAAQDLDDLYLHGSGLLSAVLGPLEQVESVSGDKDSELQVIRDECIVAVMQALRAFKRGAGALLQEDESRRIQAGQAFARWHDGDCVKAPLALYQSTVLPEWVDYNGHMTEAAYLTAFGWASDALFRYVGDDEAYRESGLSFYTVETHINYFQECSTGDPLRFTTQILGLDEKRMHIFHSMYHGHSGELLATTEQMLLHVDMKAVRACPIREDVYEALAAVRAVHQDMEMPKQVGRQMAIKKR